MKKLLSPEERADMLESKLVPLNTLDSISEIAAVQKAISKPGYVQIVDLPSKFAFYPVGSTLHVRKFTISECKKLVDTFTGDENNFNSTLNGILANSIYGVDIENIVRKDRFYIVLYMLVLTYPTGKFFVPWGCSNCNGENKYSLNIDDVEVTDFNTKNKIKDILADEFTFSYSPCTVGKDNIIDTMIATYGSDNLDHSLLEIIKNCSDIAGEVGPVEMYNKLSNMSAADPALMLATIDDYEFGVIPEVNVECSHCKEVASLALRFHGALFMPSVIRQK